MGEKTGLLALEFWLSVYCHDESISDRRPIGEKQPDQRATIFACKDGKGAT